MSWKMILKQKAPHCLPPMTVSIWASGVMAVTPIAELLGNAVEVLHDKESGKLALKPVPAKTDDSFDVRLIKGQSTYVINMASVLSTCGLQRMLGHKFAVTREGELFVIECNTS